MKNNGNDCVCPFCKKIIKKGDAHHIKKCIENYVNNLSDYEKSEIIRLYNEEGYSMIDMSEYLSFKYSTTTKILKRLGLERRNLSDACSKKRCRNKYKESCIKHFGTEHNFSKNCESRKKWENRLFDNEGIVNVFQRDSVKEKIRETMLEKYGEEGIYENRRKGSFIEYYIEKYGEVKGKEYFDYVKKRKSEVNTKEYIIEHYGIDRWNEHLKKVSSAFFNNYGLNNKCAKILEKHGIEYESEYYIPLNGNHYYLYDFKIGNIIIELNGIYWHCSPKKYKPNDIVKFPNNKFIKASDKWKYDEDKIKCATDKGYKVIVIWEDEFSEEKLLNELNYERSKD